MNALLDPIGDEIAELSATALIDSPFPDSSNGDADRSGLIDQAYSEYRNLCAAGVEVDPDAFCARFPAYQTSLRRLLEVHRELERNPSMLNSLSRWPIAGEEIRGFLLEEELGRGAFARVYLARQPSIGNRQVVVKVSLHSDNEKHTLGRLQHPNVVPIYDALHADPETGFSLVYMPFLGSTTLLSVIDQLAKRQELPARASVLLDASRDDRWSAESAAPPNRVYRRGSYLDGVLYLGERIAGALDFVHSRGILHRDLKPSNVLICPNGEPVLIDFNLALDRTMAEHRLGGTLPYMPPEQLDAMARHRPGDSVPADARTDIFALGVLLYELTTSAHPFGPVPLKLKTSEARDFLLERQRRGPLRLRVRNRQIDPGLERLILRCLSWDPAGRPASARELVVEFRRLQSPVRRAQRWAAGRVRLLATVGVFVATGTAFAGYQIATLPPKEEPARLHARSGYDLYHEGKYQEAVGAFNDSLAANKNQPAVYYARGRAHQKLGNLELAIDDYRRANPEIDGRAAASLGYCYALKNVHPQSIQAHRWAIKSGVASAAVYNNLAFSLHRFAQYPEAEDAAGEAIKLDPSFRAAYYNRANSALSRWLNNGAASPAQALEDIRQAMTLGADTAYSNFAAAAICAAELHERYQGRDATNDPLYASGREYLLRAVQLGYPRGTLTQGAARLEYLADWATQLPLMGPTANSVTGLDEHIRLIDPVND